MTAKNNTTTPRELTLVRILDAPRELVFKLWADPHHLAQWWGPKDFTNPVCEFDARPGGAIRVHMRAPDGTVYPMGGEVKEVDPPHRIVFTATAHADENGEPFITNLNTVTFEEMDGKTKMTLHVSVLQTGPGSEEPLEGMEQGWSESLERLLDLAGFSAGTESRHITATRLVDAPRELVWKVWTEAEHVAPWWGPKGFTSTIQEMDVRPGGKWRLIMHGPDGTDYKNESTYVEVVKPQLLVYDHFAPNFRFCAAFIAEGDKTLVSVRMLFPSTELRDNIAAKFGAVDGLQQTLNNLAEYVLSNKGR